MNKDQKLCVGVNVILGPGVIQKLLKVEGVEKSGFGNSYFF